MITKTLKSITLILMIGLFLSLPVTNFPFFPSSFGGNSAQVRPLLIYPLAGLVFLMVLPRLISKPVPRPVLIIIIFFLWGLIVSLIPLLKGVFSPVREISIISREIRTIVTLILGLLIYLTISLYPQSRESLASILRWLYGGLILVLIWGSLQTIYILDLWPGWFDIFKPIQSFVSVRPLNPDRVIGMTYEPSAFADQLVVIWLPWVLSASINNYSVFGWRWKWITIERLLTVWTMGILAFTLSKTGLILGVGLILLGFILSMIDPQKDEDNPQEMDQNLSPMRLIITRYRILMIILSLTAFVVVFYFLGAKVPYISRIWNFFVDFNELDLRKYLLFIGFGSRITYWETAWNIFLDHPIFGVGLGNFAIYFSDYLPFQKLVQTPQLFHLLVPSVKWSRISSAKHFLIRILAEMGIVGFGLFIVFLIVLGAMGLYLWKSRNLEERFWGTASLIGLAAFLGDTFSFDSFAIPNPWVLFGLITAAFSVITNKNTNVSENE